MFERCGTISKNTYVASSGTINKYTYVATSGTISKNTYKYIYIYYMVSFSAHAVSKSLVGVGSSSALGLVVVSGFAHVEFSGSVGLAGGLLGLGDSTPGEASTSAEELGVGSVAIAVPPFALAPFLPRPRPLPLP
jgi:hypothetical protein